MGVLLPNYPEENGVRVENVPNFKINTSQGASSNVSQILQDLRLKQYQEQYHLSTVLKQYEEQYHSSTMHIDSEKSSSTTNMVQNMAQ